MDWQFWLLSIIVAYVFCEQLIYLRKKKHLPGPLFVPPILGNAASMVRNPTKFWNDQALSAEKGLSANMLFGKFMVFVRDSELSHKIFANVKPNVFHLIGHPFGKKLFGENNLIFMFGEEHKDLRRCLAPLFTPKALGLYVSIQEKTVRQHIAKWLEMASKDPNRPLALRTLCRDMNLETSQNVFVGPYLTAESSRQFTEDYALFNVGLMALPINLPGFALYKASQAVERLVRTLGECARQSKKKMAEGAEPACLVDFWMLEILREIEEAEKAGRACPHSSDIEIGRHLFDFLFAAQDASTSSLVWGVTLLESHPEVVEMVREEQKRVRSVPSHPISAEQLRMMKFTDMVVREVLRYRPPATLVPHIAACDFPITETYTVPKGAIVFPSLLESSFQGFSKPYEFDPYRFSPERREDATCRRNWLVFGAGPHQCLGQRYALNHLTLFTALFSTSVKWSRVKSKDRDEIMYAPTIVPKDDALLYLSKRDE